MFFMVHFGLLNPKETVDLTAAFNTHFQRAQQAAACPASCDDTPLSAHTAFATTLNLRLEAATACEIKKRLQSGQKTIQVPAGQSLTDVILGKQATELRIHDRDLNHDLKTLGLSL